MAAIPPLSGKGSSAWHTLLVGGQALPGVVLIDPAKGYKVDKKPGLGEDGGTSTIQGKELGDVIVTLRTFLPEHVDELAGWISILFPGGVAAPDPFSVSHPSLAMLNIKSLFFEKIRGPKPMAAPEQKRLEVQFTCTEFRSPKPVPGGAKTPQGAIDTGRFGSFGNRPKGPPAATGKTPPKITPPKIPGFSF